MNREISKPRFLKFSGKNHIPSEETMQRRKIPLGEPHCVPGKKNSQNRFSCSPGVVGTCCFVNLMWIPLVNTPTTPSMAHRAWMTSASRYLARVAGSLPWISFQTKFPNQIKKPTIPKQSQKTRHPMNQIRGGHVTTLTGPQGPTGPPGKEETNP